jgi:hypothetical protein
VSRAEQARMEKFLTEHDVYSLQHLPSKCGAHVHCGCPRSCIAAGGRPLTMEGHRAHAGRRTQPG